MRRLAYLLIPLALSTATPAEATVLYQFQSGGELSFSWTQEVFTEDFWVFNDPYDGNPDGPLLTLAEPADCNIFQIVVDGDGFTGTIPGGNEIEVFGLNTIPGGFPLCGFNFGFGNQRFDHLGTYTSGAGPATLTISAVVPDGGSTWLLSALALSGIVGISLKQNGRVRRSS